MIGVCIRYFHPNYGGMLQSYATTQILKKKGVEFELIRYEKKKDIGFYMKSIPRLFNPILLNDKYLLFSKKVNSAVHKVFKENEQLRRKQFKVFASDVFSQYEKKYCGYDSICEAAKNYDVVLTGSDQLWSPSGLESNFFNLMFVPDNIKKVSLASSFGVSNIPKSQLARTKEYLVRIPYISMRENRGAEIVKELTGRDVPVVLDPVFMLDENEWDSVSSDITYCEEPYIFAYLLGAQSSVREEIKKFAKENGLKIVTLRHANQYVKADETFGDIAPYEVGPREFLSLIRGASYVCTDSYHGCVFSVIFHKNFAVYNRYSDGSVNSKNSRIDTLCNNLQLNERRVKVSNTLDRILKEEIDYSTCDCLIENKKIAFDSYLSNALDN